MPDNVRETAGKANIKRMIDGGIPKCTWIIEVLSQVIFSTSATVHYELLIGRDEKSLDLGFPSLTGQVISTPGQLQDHQQGKGNKKNHNATQSHGIFSTAVTLEVDDTASLWNKPALPEWSDDGGERGLMSDDHSVAADEHPIKKRKRVHLVVLTHGLHSNLGSDMLYLKESIDAAAKQAREDARKRKMKRKSKIPTEVSKYENRGEVVDGVFSTAAGKSSIAPLSGGQDELDTTSGAELEDEEEVIVRGFSGNAVRTERGIQYLGKRLAKYILQMTYPDQPFLPVKKSVKKKMSQTFSGQPPMDLGSGLPTHIHSSIHRGPKKAENLAYKITSISFIAHSLGGLTQTYAIAYIHKNSPHFFQEIRPINFVTMASPLLGLSNENPIYVKFALDFGLVGRTGQDLGLRWRAPTMVRNGWDAMIGGLGSEGQRALRQPDPSSKPLLRILPTGPAREVLKMFRNRTVYSNVVNDGIVPLRTSCLLFLDWSGLGRVEKARRENGIVGTMAGWGWAELTGANSSSHRRFWDMHDDEIDSQASKSSVEAASSSHKKAEQAVVPQPAESSARNNAGGTDNEIPEQGQIRGRESHMDGITEEDDHNAKKKDLQPVQPVNPIDSFFNFLRPVQPKPRHISPKRSKIYTRSQTLNLDTGDSGSVSSGSTSGLDNALPVRRSRAVRGGLTVDDPEIGFTPPKTSFFEAAGDLLNPPLPSIEFIINPASRPRTIFHDRVYHPEDIPDPPAKKRRAFSRTFSNESNNGSIRSDKGHSNEKASSTKSGMKVEEKIARAYHHDVSWRKVLVRLEPDAHNNICVRRMFSNAYGWPVIKHLVDTHFSDSFVATTADAREPNRDRAKPMGEAVGEHGEEVNTAAPHIDIQRTDSELREAKDNVGDLNVRQDSGMSSSTGRPRMTREDSAQWDDALFDVTDDDSEMGDYDHSRRDLANHGDSDGTLETEALDTKISQSSGSSPTKVEIPQQFNNESVDRMYGETDASNAMIHSKSPSDTPLVIRGGTTSVGLGKSVQEQLAKIGGMRLPADQEACVNVDQARRKDSGNGDEPSSVDPATLP